MKKWLLGSLKLQITLASVLLVASAVAGVVYYMQQEMEEVNRVEQYKNARNLLQAVQVSVENQYNSILFHRKTMLAARKKELCSVVTAAYTAVQGYYELAQMGKLTEQDAKQQAIAQLRKFRYEDGVGYVWINDTSRPFARMIMHPVIPRLEGQLLDAPEFNCALGQDKNLFMAFVDTVTSQGEGYVDYLWPKPTAEGLSRRQPKISFVKEFKPWGWVLGTGLYVDDLDLHVNNRLQEVLVELNKTFGRVKIADSGYFYIFTGKRRMIYHPLYKGDDVINTLVNPATGNMILDDLMVAAKRPDGKIEYVWDKPQDPGQFHYKKVSFVSYFAPLDWYIGSSFYVDEVEYPARQLRRKALIFSLFFLVLAMVVAFYAAHSITRPLQRIMNVFAAGAKGDYTVRLNLSREDEFGRLASYFNNFMLEIDESHHDLAHSENRFRTLFEKSADARLIIEDEHFSDCNEALVKMLRCHSKEDVLNRRPEDLSPELQPDGRNSAEKAKEMIELAHERGSLRFYWVHTRMDGTDFPAEIELTHIPYQGRKLLHVLWRDITEQQEIEQQLMQSQKMEAVGTLAGGIAHDFNNILTAIMGYTELAQMQQDNPERLKYNLKEIEAATIRARDLVRQILTFSRKSGQEKKLLRMSLVVKEALKLLRSTIPTSIEFKEDILSEGQVLADATQIHQIIMNLCTNAFHAMRDDNRGVLSVSLNREVMTGHHSEQGVEFVDGEYLHLQVNDTGKGMDQHTMANIFEPYFTSKEIGEGTGLGLAVVHGIVKGHGGYITVDSEVGKGATFHVYLPLYEVEEQVETGMDSVNGQATGHGWILFVDDEENITSLAQEFFSSCGYDISCFNEPVQALKAFKEQPEKYDILITDMAMPEMIGDLLAQDVLQLRPALPVILCTGYSEQIDQKRALALGIRKYIQKPVVMSELEKCVRQLLADE